MSTFTFLRFEPLKDGSFLNFSRSRDALLRLDRRRRSSAEAVGGYCKAIKLPGGMAAAARPESCCSSVVRVDKLHVESGCALCEATTHGPLATMRGQHSINGGSSAVMNLIFTSSAVLTHHNTSLTESGLLPAADATKRSAPLAA